MLEWLILGGQPALENRILMKGLLSCHPKQLYDIDIFFQHFKVLDMYLRLQGTETYYHSFYIL